jgi:DNA-binding IclR family transcriptional regulator
MVSEMAEWTFLTNHGRALLEIARDPGVRLRDLAVALGTTERTAFGVVADLSQAGYVTKRKQGRRNHYEIEAHRPLQESSTRERTIGDLLDLLVGGLPRR